MAASNSDNWSRAIQARDMLVSQFMNREGVQMIDISSDPSAPGKLVIRVFVKPPLQEIPGLPAEVNGVPVRVLAGGFKME